MRGPSNFRPKEAKAEMADFPELTKTKEIIQSKLGADIVKNGDKLQDELEADSLDLVEVIMEVEDTFDLEVPDDDADALGPNVTPFQIADYVRKRKNGAPFK